MHPEQYASIPLDEILNRLLSFRGWIDGVCITGGEPTLHRDLPSLIREVREHGFLVKLDTNGSNPEMLGRLVDSGVIDFVSMDVKAPLDPTNYRRLTGCSVDLDLLWRSIRLLERGKVDHEFRVTVVPGLHREEDIQTLGRQLRVGPRLILQNFNPANPLDPLLKNTLPYDQAMLRTMEREVQEIL
jgi:pyruvate formate lyase activating enzyme